MAYQPLSAEKKAALAAFIKLMRAAETVSATVHRDLQTAGLTVSQFGILEALYHLGPMVQKELAEKILKSPGNITMVLNNLEKRGLIVREKSPADRRASVITATANGLHLIDTIFPAHAARITEAMARLSGQEQEELGTLLKKLGRSAVQAAGADHPLSRASARPARS